MRPRYRRLGPSSRRSGVEIDVHSHVLSALDQHLGQLQAIRAQLSAARVIGPGARLRLVSASASSARRYLSEVTAVTASLG